MKIFLDFPDNVTNGDVLKALFPNGHMSVGNKNIYYNFGDGYIQCHKDWWNSPYGKEKEKPIITYNDLEEEDDI